MTSGSFATFPLASIFWADRLRQEIADEHIQALAESIGNRGLIHPPVVQRSGELVAGECRVRAMRSLGWTDTSVQFADELSAEDLLKIELEENIKRRDMTWQEQVRGMDRLHNLYKSTEAEWTQDKTAEAIGLDVRVIKKNLAVAREMERNPAVINAPKLSVARNITDRNYQRRTAKESEALSRSIAEPPVVEAVLCADFNAWAPAYTGPLFNFLHCDFPYGINADKHNQGGAARRGGYSDTPDTYRSLLTTLTSNIDTLLTPSAHVIFWFSMEYYNETLETLRNHFTVSSFPLVWFKSDNSGILPKPNHGPRQVYETAFFGYRGERPVVRAKSNTYAAPSTREDHMSVKSEPMLRHFFEMVVDNNTSMLDPTAGSGSSLRAARGLGADRVVGLEVNPEFAERANLAFRR